MSAARAAIAVIPPQREACAEVVVANGHAGIVFVIGSASVVIVVVDGYGHAAGRALVVKRWLADGRIVFVAGTPAARAIIKTTMAVEGTRLFRVRQSGMSFKKTASRDVNSHATAFWRSIRMEFERVPIKSGILWDGTGVSASGIPSRGQVITPCPSHFFWQNM